MSYKTILVHVDLSRHAPQRIRLAAQLAQTQGAHLIGVAALGVSRAVFPQGYHAAPGSLEASYFDALRDKAERALAQFRELAGATAASFEARLVEDLASDALARMGRFSDLVMLNQDDPDEALCETGGRIPEYVVLTCSRPVLVLPCTPVAAPPGRHVLVAWNGSKQAAAALGAALPLLQRAVRVSVVSFRTPDDAELLDARQQADLSAYLARHGVQADILGLDRDIDAGQALLAFAAQENADLIVMGCYGHSQFRELFLGGVSRTMLNGAPLPVLMAQ